MKSKFILVENNTWSPPSFYDTNTQLIWVMDYKLFRNVYVKNLRPPSGYKYAIHRDVYNAFLYKLQISKNNRKTRKIMKRKNNEK